MTAAPAPSSDGVPEPIRDEASHTIEIVLPQTLQPYARRATRWRIGCEVTVLRDGAATFDAMLAAIAAAQRSILLETYILAQDRTGERFKKALIARAQAGVAVRVTYDSLGSFGLPEGWLAELRGAGGEVLAFNSIAPWRARFNLSHRDHRKILVVDDEVAFTGGLNISNDYAAVADGGAGWHDTHCRLHGPIVRDLARLFRRTWISAGGRRFPAAPRAELASGSGTSVVRMLENGRRRQRAAIRRAYLHVIRAARESVLIENAYFLPDRGLRRALVRAVRRGVEVRVIVPGRSDVQLVEWAGLYVHRRLARFGIQISRWRGVMMHAKTAVVDGMWSTIGSYNFDAQSRFNNLEVTVEILDPTVGAALVAQFEADLASCERFDEAAWLRMPWWRKAFAWLAYRFRRIL